MPQIATAAWFDAAWPYRRALEVKWDANRPTGEDVGWADIYTAGHADAKGRDLRIATDDGKLVPSRVLFAGPGDVVRVAFAMPQGEQKFYAYFGNKKLDDKKPEPLKARAALLMESRIHKGGQVGGFDAIEAAWDKGGDHIGSKYLGSGMLGYNPFGEQQQVVSKLSGAIFAAVDGEYEFAISVDDVGALYVAGKPLVFARIGPGDARHHGKVKLTRGRHDLLFYHVDYGGDTRFTLAWKPPTATKYDVIGRAETGAAFGAVAGPLEQQKKPLVADFTADHVSESWTAGNYAHRYKFTGRLPAGMSGAKFAWDFGDGQTATGATVDHVYVTQGVYPVRVTARIGNNSDAQTTQFHVARDYDAFRGNPLAPPSEAASVFAEIVAEYDVGKMPLNWLAPAADLLSEGGKPDAARAVAVRIATEKKHADRAAVLDVLREAPGDAAAKVALWERVPADSDLQPTAAQELAELLLWTAGDFAKAVTVLEPFKDKGQPLDRVRLGQAYVLAGRVDDGAKLLEAVDVKDEPAKRAAISGAMARTIEAFLQDDDWESGNASWDDWMTRFPTDFLSGYPAVLKVQLIERSGHPVPAAKVAEAFAGAVPNSPYAPTLLDRAARLLEKSDAEKSKALRQRLKEKYPEDPLSQ
ncbi:MAG TPA: PKD domain-containing protein [Tepidisphaeraceae bacterium]|nr:PKD domain-containing protein [Tepidisphaeraceae bacterium]